MANSAQTRAMENYRARLSERGISRFEVQAPRADRELIKAVARKLAGEGPEALALRQALTKAVAKTPTEPGGILAALRRSPLVGADLDVARPPETGRKVDL